jgi:UDPglucose--hexose-1-phosphate uridylyltransferase
VKTNLLVSEQEGAKKNIKKTTESELRQDIVTGDWVVIATGRAKRPDDFGKAERIKDVVDPADCVFCDPVKSGQEKDLLLYEDSVGEWTLRVFPNKFPAFSRGKVPMPLGEGPYFAMTGTGYHEVIVTRDHDRQIAQMEPIEIAEVFDAFQERYLDLMNKRSVNYISMFHNLGKEVGGSVAHPHSQLMAIPVISPYVQLELDGAELYARSNRKCVYCVMAEYEKEKRTRVIFENEHFIAFCPFASRVAFETWIMPKKHSPYFERINESEKLELGTVFHDTLGAIFKALNDPPYNFYIHTSPCDGKDYPHYHWHIEILPHTSTWAGFELETGIEISTIQPEVAAEYLRKML